MRLSVLFSIMMFFMISFILIPVLFSNVFNNQPDLVNIMSASLLPAIILVGGAGLIYTCWIDIHGMLSSSRHEYLDYVERSGSRSERMDNQEMREFFSSHDVEAALQQLMEEHAARHVPDTKPDSQEQSTIIQKEEKGIRSRWEEIEV